MRYRQLGDSDLHVSEISLGSWLTYGGGVARKVQLLRSEGFELGKADERLPDGVVWGHKGTKIYCRTNCRTTARVDRTRILFFADSREAKQAGLRPCKICRPA